MASFREYRRRSMIPLAGAILAGVYLLFFLPLERKSRELESPLQKEWRALATALGRTNASSLDFLSITNELNRTRRALEILWNAREEARRALALEPALVDKLESGSFQLIDYQIVSSQKKDALAGLAKKEKVALDPSVLIHFPEYTVDVTQPELLWASLSMVHGLLTTAVQSKVGSVHALSVPVVLTNTSTTGWRKGVVEIPFQIEVTGPAQAVRTLLQALPLRGTEIQQQLGLAEVPKDKPPLFLDQLVVRKQTPEQPDEVRLVLRVLGFILRE